MRWLARYLTQGSPGRRLYVTNSLYSTWDNQFYPEMRSWPFARELRPQRRHGGRPRLLC
jgi:hypothetical protein